MSDTPKPPSMDDLLRESESTLRELGAGASKPEVTRNTTRDERRQQALQAARKLAGKAPTRVNAAQRALDAAAQLEAQSADARRQLAEMQALREAEAEGLRAEAEAARQRAEANLRAKMATSQPSPQADEEMKEQQRRQEEARRRAIQESRQRREKEHLEQAQPASGAPPLAPQLPIAPDKQMEFELAQQRDALTAPLAVALTPIELSPQPLTGRQESLAVPPDPMAQNSTAPRTSELDRKMQQRGYVNPVPLKKSGARNLSKMDPEVRKTVSSPAVVAILLVVFFGPPALVMIVAFVVLFAKAINGDLTSPGAPKKNFEIQRPPQDLRRAVKPAYAFTREMAETRILQGHKLAGKNEFGYPLLQIGDRQIDVHTYYMSLYNTRTNTLELLPEDFFRMGLMLEFACFEKPGAKPMYSIAVAAFQTAAIYGHEEALSRYWALFDNGHDPQRVFKPRDTARQTMRNRDPKWSDPTE